jgi:hypothetical protein
MADTLERFIDPSLRYNFHQGPAQVRSMEDARQNGLNCVSLAHLAMRDMFDQELPPELHCAEMYVDREHFTTVRGIHDMQKGDLVWFGIEDGKIEPEEFRPVYDAHGLLVNWRDFPVKHVTIATGMTDERADPLLLHATHFEGTSVVWPLRKFSEYRRYRRLFGITRLIAAAETHASAA